MESTKVNVNGFKYIDLEELSRIYDKEYNSVDIHDRVLVFDIVQDECDDMVTTEYSPQPSEGKSPTSNENTDEKSSSSVGSELAPKVLQQNEEDLVKLPELGDQPDRKRPSSEEDNHLSIVKRPREDLLNNEARADEVGSSVAPDFDTPLSSEDVIDADADARVSSEEKAADDEPQLPSSAQTSPWNPSASDVLRQHNIFVHSTWLAVHSDYFRSLFYSGMKESNSKEVHVRVPESEENGHLMMLEAIYRLYILDTASVEELLLVLELADKYNISFVFRKCTYVLQAMELSLDICEKIMFVLEVKHNMTDVLHLTNTIQKFLAKEFSPLDTTWETEKFKTLSKPLLRSLLSSNDVTTQSENTVFHALMHWIRTNNYDPSTSEQTPNSSSLLTVVRFELLSIDYLYNVVQNHSIATKITCFTDLYLKGISYHALPEGIRKHLVKPVARGKVNDDFVQYTWVIEKVTTLADEAIISSDKFWCCGYLMRMILEKKGSNYRSGINITIFLTNLSFTRKSEFRVYWRVKCKNIYSDTSSGEITFSDEQKIAKLNDFNLILTEDIISFDIIISPSS